MRGRARALTCRVASEISWLTARITQDGKENDDARDGAKSAGGLCPQRPPSDRRRALHVQPSARLFPWQTPRWRDEILRSTKETRQHLHEETVRHPDLADRATSETERGVELRAGDRQRKLIAKIDAALARLDDGTYGYCEETGEPISLMQLEARPVATLSVDAQERHERRERFYSTD